jgi:aminopeptidase
MYKPSNEILEKYANVLVNFALNSGKGIKKGEVVFVQVPECAKPMLIALQRAILKAGGNIILQYSPDEISREYYELANDEQLKFFPSQFIKARVDVIDHLIAIDAEVNKHELEGISPGKIMERQKAWKPYFDWRDEKENAGKFTWTIGLYGTEEMAKEVGLTVEEYWDEIIKACYLDTVDPVKKWKEIFEEIERIRAKLDSLKIEKVHVKSESTDLTVKLGKGRKWLGGSGRNIPSFELFISPDWRGTEGKIQFTEPLYRYGNIIERAYLEFKNGKVVFAKAEKGENILKEMITVENADKIGEFSLTDCRLSRISKFMGETLYDENVGGKYGNTHIALGKAYQDSYPGNPSKVSEEEWSKLGYNSSVIHTDIVSTENRVVTATLEDGSEIVIYRDGKFNV